MPRTCVVFCLSLGIEESAILVTYVHIFIPTLKQKVGIIAKVYILACDAAVNLEHSVLV